MDETYKKPGLAKAVKAVAVVAVAGGLFYAGMRTEKAIIEAKPQFVNYDATPAMFVDKAAGKEFVAAEVASTYARAEQLTADLEASNGKIVSVKKLARELADVVNQ